MINAVAVLVSIALSMTSVDATPPAMQVIGPADDATVRTRVVTFWGVTEHGASVRSGPFLADTDPFGNWTIDLILATGQNGAVFTATDEAGNEKSVKIVVNREEPAAPTPEAPEAANVVRTVSVVPVVKVVSVTTTTVLVPDPMPVVVATGVEQWRSLVEKHFAPSQVSTAMRVMACESLGIPDAKNPRSGAGGLFQHLPKYWASRAASAGYPGASIYDAEANIAAAAWLSSNHGWGHWTCY